MNHLTTSPPHPTGRTDGRSDWEAREYERDHGKRAATALAFRLAGEFIRSDEDGPVPPPFLIYAPVEPGADGERMAAVDAWAAKHHVTAGWYQDGHHYGAQMSFGPLTLLVYMVPAAVLDVPAPREAQDAPEFAEVA